MKTEIIILLTALILLGGCISVVTIVYTRVGGIRQCAKNCQDSRMDDVPLCGKTYNASATNVSCLSRGSWMDAMRADSQYQECISTCE